MLWMFFFFKQETGYDMRICDWSSDVCSSDLEIARRRGQAAFDRQLTDHVDRVQDQVEMLIRREPDAQRLRRAVEIEVRQFAGPVVVTDDLRVRGDRKSVVEGKSVSVRGDRGGRRRMKKKNKKTHK